ncbi:MAG: DEAD/DEAH box helicase [Candidatus Pristimantibacillus lignocellulolyticus]|uniref:ATP-dependent RNA helicase CshA n=1 Tax=Candidatus Pristimantibacillus lignocellulolyticus TaxID=2994561 RepID=A0A9J6ZK82_9BACL|nr:MAG: DEAD/DEAH box helicase [Candidatus Pristimantibacillus lignocellulolyticus]
MTFNDLNIAPEILKGLSKENYTTPTPIQEQAIPAVLAGRDLLGCAQTGTGKTAAFAVPIIQLLSNRKSNSNTGRRIRSLILTPTRELAIQISDNIKAYSLYTDVLCTAIVGGVSQKVQERALNHGADIIIATPGRLIDLITQKRVDLQYVEILVLDEADRMLDMGFIKDVKSIIAKMPSKRQTLFFSATMPPEISKMVKSILVNPVKVEITPVSSTADRIEQSIYLMESGKKQHQLNDLLQDESIVSALVFTRTKRGADRVTKELNKVKISAQAIHGNKSQNDRQNALNNFKSGATRVLVATDIAARGIDVEELSHVINFNLPNIPETYVHRIGRTGRAGQSGTAISFCDIDEIPYLKDIEKLIGKSIPEVKDHAYPMKRTPQQLNTEAVVQPVKAKSNAARKYKSETNPARNPKPEVSSTRKPKSEVNKTGKPKFGTNSARKPKSETSSPWKPKSETSSTGRPKFGTKAAGKSKSPWVKK